MKKEVSLDEAISKGILLIKVPIILIFLIIICFGIYFAVVYQLKSYFSILFVFVGFFTILAYSILIVPKWKVWAFGNVRNVHELRKKALSKNLMARENVWTTKAEIFFGDDKQKWQEIQKKFLIPDETSFDENLPNSIEIYNSQFKLLIPIIFYSAFIILIIYSMIIDKNVLGLGIFGLLAFGLFLYFGIVDFEKRNTPVFTINYDGIKYENNFYKWHEIKDERLKTVRGYKSFPNFYLAFNLIKNDNEVKISINSIKMKRSQLLNLIIDFRNRFDAENKI